MSWLRRERGFVVRLVRTYARSASPSMYRPLPDPSVAWRPDEAEEARRVAHDRNMKFNDCEAAALPQLHTSLAAMRHQRAALEDEQKQLGAAIPSLAKSKAEPERLEHLRERARELRTAIRTLEKQIDEGSAWSLGIRSAWPNRMHPDVPKGPESESRVVMVHDARVGDAASVVPPLSLPCTIRELDVQMQSNLEPDTKRDHLALAQAITSGGIDMAAGITTTGPSWPYLVGSLSMLEHALSQYALHVANTHGFIPVSVPDVIKTDIAERCGFRPRDEVAAQTYLVDTRHEPGEEEAGLCLAGTAEIPLAALVAKHTYASAQGEQARGDIGQMHLPIQLTALGHAFRAEAGARGADTRGLYRIHQFSKVELFVVTEPENSDAMLERLCRVQQDIVNGLGLLYRVLDMSSEELGASAYRKYDIEAWMPGRGGWGEICSASNCTDYQARRLAIKYRDAGGKAAYAHTLNATAAAIPRLVLALVENYASKELVLPSTLRPFWIGGSSDSQVRWIEVGKTTPTMQPAPPPRNIPTNRAFHTSTRHSSSFMRAKAQVRALAARTGADPAPLLAAFLLLHELTAIVPLFVFAFLLTVLGAGDAILEWVDATLQSIMPSENARFYAWIDRGRKMATRMCSRCDAILHGQEGAPMAAAWFTSLTAAYVLVKLFLPVRIAASLALTPVTARTLIMPLWRRCFKSRHS